MKKKVAWMLPCLCLVSGLLLNGTFYPEMASAEGKSITLRFTTGWPENHASAGVRTKIWIEQVEKVTEGRVKIRGVWGGALSKPGEILEHVADGVADLGYEVWAYHPGKLPMTTALSALIEPKLGRFMDQRLGIAIAQKLYDEYLYKEYEALGLKVVLHYGNPVYALASKMPIKKLDDLKGVKIRAFGTYLPIFLKASGAVPVAVSFGEMYTALQTGVIQAAYTDPDAMFTSKIYEVAPYITTLGKSKKTSIGGIPTGYPSVGIFFNLDSWNKISKADRDAIEKMSREIQLHDEMLTESIQVKRLADMKAEGATISYLDKEEMAKWADQAPDFLKIVAADLNAKGLPGTEFINRWKELLEDALEGRWGPPGWTPPER
jgi:TRAP-type C4-dicarboxylate transport system substrate-binding protein